MLEVLDSEAVSLESADTKETALHIAARCSGRAKPINIKNRRDIPTSGPQPPCGLSGVFKPRFATEKLQYPLECNRNKTQ